MGKIILMVSLGLTMMSCENRWYFYSPNEKKCITFIDHENKSFLYVVPGKYDKWEKPKSNYLLIKWSEDHNFDVNWAAKKYRFAYPLVIENALDTEEVDFSYALREDEKVMINGEFHYKFPEVEGFALPYITRGSYVDKRKEMHEAINLSDKVKKN